MSSTGIGSESESESTRDSQQIGVKVNKILGAQFPLGSLLIFAQKYL